MENKLQTKERIESLKSQFFRSFKTFQPSKSRLSSYGRGLMSNHGR